MEARAVYVTREIVAPRLEVTPEKCPFRACICGLNSAQGFLLLFFPWYVRTRLDVSHFAELRRIRRMSIEISVSPISAT